MSVGLEPQRESRRVLIYYHNEWHNPNLFGFFMVPVDMNLKNELRLFRQARPKLIDFAGWLIRRGANSEVDLDKARWERAQKGGPIIRPKTDPGDEGKYTIIKPGLKPIEIDLESINAEKFKLVW